MTGKRLEWEKPKLDTVTKIVSIWLGQNGSARKWNPFILRHPEPHWLPRKNVVRLEYNKHLMFE